MDLIEKYLGLTLSEGRDTTPKYVIDMKTRRGYNTPSEWKVKAQYGMKGYGKPSKENLKKFIEAYNDSLKPGEVNAKIGKSGEAIWAGVRENYGGAPYIAEWKE